MRTLSGPAVAVLAGKLVPMALLIEMDLTSALNLNTGSLDLIIGGTTYYGTKGLGKVEAVASSPAEIKPMAFELAGVRSDILSLALTEPVQGKAVRLKLALFDPSTYANVTTVLCWSGLLDVMSIVDHGSVGTVTVTAENGAIDLTRPGSSMYTDAEQQRLHTGDLFLQFMADQVEQRIVWPNANWGRK